MNTKRFASTLAVTSMLAFSGLGVSLNNYVVTMLKAFHLIPVISIASILFATETAFSRPPATDSRYPVVPSSDINNPVCFMQTADGRTLNLSSLCRKVSQPTTQAQPHCISKYQCFDTSEPNAASPPPPQYLPATPETISPVGLVIPKILPAWVSTHLRSKITRT